MSERLTDIYAKRLLREVKQRTWFYVPPKKLTQLERIRYRMTVCRERVHNAWLVLIGKRSVGDEW